MVKQYGQLYLDTRHALLETEDAQTAGMMARQLLCHFSGKSPEAILADRDLYASEQVCRDMSRAVRRLLDGEPLAYVLGEWEFYGLPLRVTPDVLIPRDDTCAVAELAIRKALFLEQDPRILDLCCGSGCIGLAIASRVKDAKVTLADLSMEALAIAKENTGLNRLGGRVRCVQADATKKAPAFLGKYDMIVSNPPYLTAAEMQQLQPEVAREPAMALEAGEDGLVFYRALAEHYQNALRPGGALALEIGWQQREAVTALLEANGWADIACRKDFGGNDRCVTARRPK